MPVIQSPGQRINNMRVIEFPLWLILSAIL